MNHVVESNRLWLRELNFNDKDDLKEIFCDKESMKYYPSVFTEEKVENWIIWNMDNYSKHKCGLWAVILKDSGECIGDCGITMQNIEGQVLPEIGYHIKKKYNGIGLATEAASACKKYGFEKLGFTKLFSFTTPDNISSRRVAEKIGMKLIKSFEKNGIKEVLYCLEVDD